MSVYLAHDQKTGLLKIGNSKNVHQRISSFGSKSRITLLGALRDTDFAAEKEIKDRFRRYRVHGEWFADVNDIRDWFASQVFWTTQVPKLGKVISVRHIPSKLWRKLRIAAIQERKTMTDIVDEALKAYLNRKDGRK